MKRNKAMMKRLASLVVALTTFSVANPLTAQSPAAGTSAPPAPAAIVTLNFNAAVLATAEARRDFAALQTKFASRESEIQKLNEALQAEKKQLSDDATKLSDSERNTKIQDMNTKDKQLQREAEDYKNDTQSESQQVFQRVAQKLFTLVQDYSKQHGYAAVIERGTDEAPIVWYAANDVDITDQVAKAYDLKFGSDLPDRPGVGTRSPGTPAKPQATKPQSH
jgi:outer membrane protein